MKNCPQCGQPRQGEAFKCPTCDVFYSQLDQFLYEEQQELEKTTLNGFVKRILAAENRQQAFRRELGVVWNATPLKTKITLWTIFAFVFALVFAI